MTMAQELIYRPEWTCGRYSPKAGTAIMYNLISGKSFFFESHSAAVIRELLNIPKNGYRSLESLSKSTGISSVSIRDFMGILAGKGLVTDRLYSREETEAIRRNQGRIFRETQVTRDDLWDAEQLQVSGAEQRYAQSLGLDMTVPTAMIELTYNCSERCIHCYNSGAARNDCEVSHRGRKEMTLDDYKRVIDELYGHGVCRICLSGGDPFSKPHVWDIIDYIFRKDIAMDIFTNGQAITGCADRLAWYYPHLVGLSVYSAVPEVHDSITRVPGSLGKTLSVAGQLSDLGVNMAFKCVIFRTNVKSYHTVKGLAKRYGAVPKFDVNLSNGIDGDVSVVANLGIPDEVMEIVLRDSDIPLHVSLNTESNLMAKPLDAFPCNAGIQSFSITPEGDLQPCCAFPLSFGNLQEAPMADILKAGPLKRIRGISIGDIRGCGRQEKCGYCFLCIGNGFIEHGSLSEPPAGCCHLAELRYNLMRKLKEGKDPLEGKTVEDRLNEVDIPETHPFGRTMGKSYRNRTL